MNSELHNTNRYRTRKETRGKQNRDNTGDKELTLMSIVNYNMPVGIEHGRKAEAKIVFVEANIFMEVNNAMSSEETTADNI